MYSGRGKFMPLPLKSKILETPGSLVTDKEDIKEQPTSRNLSATARRVPQCTCPVAATQKDFSAFHTSSHLTPCPHT
jgi:hypothetical protein